VSKKKTILLCALPGLAAVLPMLLKGSPVLNNDMLVAYFCYFWDFHKAWSFAHPLPLWSSSYQCGMPMHAYWQSGYLYPVTWILFGPISPFIGIHLFYAFHFSLGIFGFLKLGPHLRLKPFAAYWAGLCFGLSGTLLARYEHATFLAGWAWLPAVLAAFLALRDAPGAKTLCAYAACVAMQALGGHPQASAATAFLIGIFTVACIGRAVVTRRLPKSERTAGGAPGPSPRSLAWVLGGHVLALVWCLPLLIPFLKLVNDTDRYDGVTWEKGPVALAARTWQSADFDFEKFSTGALRPVHLLSLAAPHALGTPSNGSWWGGEVWGEVFVYIGGLGLFFCLFASPRRANADLRWLWVAGLFGLWLSFGPALGASQIQYHIPFLNDFRRPARFLILFVLGLAPLSAHGLQRWAARPRAHGAYTSAILASVLAVGLAYLRFHPDPLGNVLDFLGPMRSLHPCAHYLRKMALLMGRYSDDSAVLALSAAAILFYAQRAKAVPSESGARLRRRRLRRRALSALFLVLLFDLLRLHWDHFYLFPASFYREPPASAAIFDKATQPFWRVNHYLEYPGHELWRMHNDPMEHFPLLEREKTALSCGIHAVFGYRHVSAHLPLLWRWDENTTPGGKSGRYLLSNRDLPEFHGDSLTPLGRFGEVIAYEVKGWRPRLENLRAAPDSAAASACEEGYSGYRDVCVREPRDGTVLVHSRWKAGDTLLFRERYAVGWRYRVDGGSWSPAQENHEHFMALPVGKAAGRMEIEYHPGGFYRLAACSYGLSGLFLLLGFLLSRFRGGLWFRLGFGRVRGR
jgi:hypothetical protein